MFGPYSDFESLVGKLTWKASFKNDINQQIKTDLYESRYGSKYVLKAFWIYFDASNNHRNNF